MRLAWVTAKPGGSITLATRAWSNASLADTGGRPHHWRHWPWKTRSKPTASPRGSSATFSATSPLASRARSPRLGWIPLSIRALNPLASERFFAMVKHNQEQYFLSFTRYSTNAFFRHQLGKQFTQASLENNIYKSFEEAKEHL